MLKQTKGVRSFIVIGVLAATSAMGGAAFAREDAPSKLQNKVVLGQDQANQLVLHTGTYKGFEVSMQESMKPTGTVAGTPEMNGGANPAATDQAQADSHGLTFAFFGK
jgi:hypothetical protein